MPKRSIALLPYCVALALIAGWAAQISLAEEAGPEGVIDLAADRSRAYHVSHALSIVFVLASGALALLNGAWNRLPLSARLASAVLTVTAALWSVAAYPLEQIFSTTILGATGPFVWLTLVFVVAGADPRVERLASALVPALAYATALAGLVALLRVPPAVYSIGLSKHTQYAILLTWLAGWTLLSSARSSGWRLLGGMAPFAVLLPLDITSQSRSWTLLGVLLLVTFFILRGRELGWYRSVMVAGGLGSVALLVASFVALTAPQLVLDRVDRLSERAGEDTRSGQYEDFFNDVQPAELLLGRGPKGTWYWTDVGDYQFFDNGLLWMAFIGGVPTLLSYLALVLWPGLRAAARGLRGADAVPAVMLIFWGIALAGLSTFTLPSVSFTSFVVSLWAGHSHLALSKAKPAAASW